MTLLLRITTIGPEITMFSAYSQGPENWKTYKSKKLTKSKWLLFFKFRKYVKPLSWRKSKIAPISNFSMSHHQIQYEVFQFISNTVKHKVEKEVVAVLGHLSSVLDVRSASLLHLLNINEDRIHFSLSVIDVLLMPHQLCSFWVTMQWIVLVLFITAFGKYTL